MLQKRLLIKALPFAAKWVNRGVVDFRLWQARNAGLCVEPYSQARNYFRSKSGVFHVVGSGWSAPYGLEKIGSNDGVSGMNFSGALNLSFDVYTVELAHGTNIPPWLAERQIDVVSHHKGKGTKVYFKNLWMLRSSIKMVHGSYNDLVSILPDIPLWREIAAVDNQIDALLEPDDYFAKQTSSSVILHIISAFHAQNHTIVLHGIDFRGPPFYRLDESGLTINRFRPSEKEIVDYGSHKTAVSSAPLEQVVAELRERFARRNVRLLTATEESGSKAILPVYDPS